MSNPIDGAARPVVANTSRPLAPPHALDGTPASGLHLTFLLGRLLVCLVVGLFFLRRMPKVFRRDLSRLFAGGLPANNPRRTASMASTPTQAPAPSAPAKAPRKVLKGVSIESANRNGLKTGGVWYDYGKVFKGEKPDPQEAVGSVLDLQLVESKSDKRKKHGESTWFIEAILACSKPSAPAPAAAEASPPQEASGQAEILPGTAETPPPAAVPHEPASEGQLRYAKDLWRKLEMSDAALNSICRLRFQGRELAQLTKDEMRQFMIPFLGGHVLSN